MTSTAAPTRKRTRKSEPAAQTEPEATDQPSYGSDEPDAQALADAHAAAVLAASRPIPDQQPTESTVLETETATVVVTRPASQTDATPKHITPADGQTEMVCRSCGVSKKLSQFPTVAHPVGNRGTQCRACRDAQRQPREAAAS